MTRYQKTHLIFGVIFALLCILAINVNAATFAWDANTEPDLAGYRLYRAPGSGTMPTPTCGTFVAVQSYGLVTTGVDVPPAGRWCYSLTAIDSAWPVANESGYSNRVYLQLPQDTTSPGMPGTLRVVTP